MALADFDKTIELDPKFTQAYSSRDSTAKMLNSSGGGGGSEGGGSDGIVIKTLTGGWVSNGTASLSSGESQPYGFEMHEMGVVTPYIQPFAHEFKGANPKGEIVWAWYAKDHFYESPYKDIYDQGWTHTNAVTRLSNGNTLISLRNFNFVVEVDPQGTVVKTIGEGIFHHQHDPEVLHDGKILLANHGRPERAVEVDPKTGKIVWQSAGFELGAIPVRDANRLPNGNTLITGSTKIVEVTAEGKIVWQLTLKGTTLAGLDASARGFYKAERVGILR